VLGTGISYQHGTVLDIVAVLADGLAWVDAVDVVFAFADRISLNQSDAHLGRFGRLRSGSGCRDLHSTRSQRQVGSQLGYRESKAVGVSGAWVVRTDVGLYLERVRSNPIVSFGDVVASLIYFFCR